MSEVSKRWAVPPPTSPQVEVAAQAVTVTHVEGTRERLALCRSRELVLRRLLARGLSPTTLLLLLPERRTLLGAIFG